LDDSKQRAKSDEVACSYRILDLIDLLRKKVPAAGGLAATYRREAHGLLSVGLKIHCLDDGVRFSELVEALGGPRRVLEVNHYKNECASLCLVLPPVGSAASAIRLIECIEQFIGSPILVIAKYSCNYARRAD